MLGEGSEGATNDTSSARAEGTSKSYSSYGGGSYSEPIRWKRWAVIAAVVVVLFLIFQADATQKHNRVDQLVAQAERDAHSGNLSASADAFLAAWTLDRDDAIRQSMLVLYEPIAITAAEPVRYTVRARHSVAFASPMKCNRDPTYCSGYTLIDDRYIYPIGSSISIASSAGFDGFVGAGQPVLGLFASGVKYSTEPQLYFTTSNRQGMLFPCDAVLSSNTARR